MVLRVSEEGRALETFWIGDLPESLVLVVLNEVIRGTCWNDGLSGEMDVQILLDSLERLRMGQPAKAGDRLLKVVSYQTEFMICMSDEVDGIIHVKHWSGNNKGVGWADEAIPVNALDVRRDMFGDMQIITLALYAVERLSSSLRTRFDREGQEMMNKWRLFGNSRRRFYENGEVVAIDGMLEMFDTYLKYEGAEAINFPLQAAESEILEWEAALNFLRTRLSRKIATVHLAKALLTKLKEDLGISGNPEDEGDDTGNTRRRVKYDCECVLESSFELHNFLAF